MGLREIAASPLGRKLAAGFALSAAGLGLIGQQEGREYKAYPDAVKVVTICNGHTKGVKLGDTATDAICDKYLQEDSSKAQAAVQRLVTVPITQNQYDALVDFTFNLGTGSLAKSSLLKYVNHGECLRAGAEFPKWNKANGKVLLGLTKRRALERQLWETGCSPSPT